MTAGCEDTESSTRSAPTWAQRHGLLIVGVSPIIANVIGSIFNILYNRTQIEPLLSAAQMRRFEECWQWFNLLVYPLAIACYVVPLLWLRPIHRALLQRREVDSERLTVARRRVINLPWWFLAVAAIGWLSCIPIFPLSLRSVGEPLSTDVILHLITSFLIASLIAVTQSFFAVELATQRVLFPIFFRDASPVRIPGAFPLTMTARGLLWVFSAVVSPVLSLVLILLVPDAANQSPLFGLAVGTVAIVFAIVTSWMLVRLVVTPIRQLQTAARRVAEGDLNTHVSLLRADELGLLIDRFNQMVTGLREREQLHETFGRHVGREAARQILRQGDGLSGRQQRITVMFVDVRNFTALSASRTPEQVVSGLNVFFREAVDTVETQGGMVNKFLGDGFMALFGIGDSADQHQRRAVEAGIALHRCLRGISHELMIRGWPGLQIGVGINTGVAVVGSIGSPKRQEYTAIGDTINVASRVESLTKPLGCGLLLTSATRRDLGIEIPLIPLPEQRVKGKDEPLELFAVDLERLLADAWDGTPADSDCNDWGK